MGATVTINGSNFGSSPVVKFNSTTATSSVNGAGTQITATVPSGATTGKITVEVTGQATATSATDFTVTAAGAPAVNLSPTSVSGLTNFLGYPSAATNYTVTGTNLGGTNLVVTASTNAIEVSTNSSTGFTNTLTLAPAGDGTLTNTLYVRVSALASSGLLSASVNHVSGTASNTLAVSGTVTTPALTLTLATNSVPENAGANATTGTVGIPFSLTNDLKVSLVSSNTAAATVPASVTITNGQTNATFDIAAVANTNSYVANTAVITASATNYSSASATLTVSNVDVPTPTYISLINTNANSYTQNFDALGTNTYSGVVSATTGVPTILSAVVNSTLSGWYVAKLGGTGTTALSIASGSGGGTSGGVYNFGSTTNDNLNRSLGLLASSGFFGGIGALVKNDTGGTVTGLKLGVTGKFWRGTSNNSSLVFGYGIVDGTTITTANFITVSSNVASLSAANINYTTNITTNNSALDGSLAANQVVLSNVTVPITLTNGQVAFIRWQDKDDAGNDAALAVDDVGLTAETTPIPLDGLGLASLANPAAGFGNNSLWPRATSNQTVALTVNGTFTSGTIQVVKVTLPSGFTGLASNNVAVTGAGAGTFSASVTGQVLTVSGLEITQANSATISISGLTTPQTAGDLTQAGNYVFTVQTGSGLADPQNIVSQPSAIVAIPIANLGAVDANGISIHTNKIVAVEGVCTEENFNSSSSTSAYLQNGQPDGTNKVGINVYSTLRNLFSRGNSYLVLGSVLNYSGLTEVVITNSNNVLNLGVASNVPTPVTLTINQLTNAHEAYEGSLVRVTGLRKATNGGAWALTSTTNTNGTVTTAGANVILQSGGTNLTARLNVGSTALTEPIYPAAITGIYGQFVAAAPFVGGGQIQPRDQADIEDGPALKLTLVDSQINEGGSFNSTTLTIVRTGGTTGAVVGTLSGSPVSKVRVQGTPPLDLPYNFTIPDGQASIQITIEAIDNNVYAGDALVTLTASDDTAVLASGMGNLTVLEDETAPAAPTGLSYSPSTVSGTVNTAISAMNPTVTGLVSGYSISPALPTGITINPTNGVISGTPTVTKASTVYTVTATNTTGSTTAQVTITVNPAGTTFASWSGGATLNSANLAKYAIGGASSLTAQGEAPKIVSGGPLMGQYFTYIEAVVRTDDSTLTITPESTTDLSAGFSNSGSWTTEGAPSVSQTGVPSGCERKKFIQWQFTPPGERKFLRLKATLVP